MGAMVESRRARRDSLWLFVRVRNSRGDTTACDRITPHATDSDPEPHMSLMTCYDRRPFVYARINRLINCNCGSRTAVGVLSFASPKESAEFNPQEIGRAHV